MIMKEGPDIMLVVDSRIPLPTQVTRVLQEMFAAYSRLVVRHEFSAGLSGSRVFLVRPIREGGRPELPAVVKVDYFDRIEKEWRAYQTCIHHLLPNVAQVSGQPVYPPGSQYGGLRYPLAGEGAFDVVSLQDYCRQAPVERAGYVFERLFTSLGRLWEQKHVRPDLHLRAAYDSFLPPNLVLDYAAVSPTDAHFLHPAAVQAPAPAYAVGDAVQLSGFQVAGVVRE
ncbi:MAG: hypothetical protein KC425_12100, partial [Anaerolineales bacterium]|nr:hypothetical protein [Anaerolineales bacterium]